MLHIHADYVTKEGTDCGKGAAEEGRSVEIKQGDDRARNGLNGSRKEVGSVASLPPHVGPCGPDPAILLEQDGLDLPALLLYPEETCVIAPP